MALVTFNDWRAHVYPHVPSCTESVMRDAFNLTAKEFYRRTRSWRETLRTCADPCTGVVPIEPFSQYASVCFLEGGWDADTEGELMRIPWGSGWGLVLPGYNYTVRVFLKDPHTVVVEPSNAMPRDIVLSLSLQPKLDATQLPEFALTHHFEALLEGTLYRLQSQPKKPYSDTTLASLHRANYAREVANAFGMHAHNYSAGRPVGFQFQNVRSR